MIVERRRLLRTLAARLREFPVVALLGARQVGKSTLARAYAASRRRATYFDLERAPDLAQLAEAHLTLSRLRGLVVIDEVQRRPELFATLRVLADAGHARFLVLGSASPELLRQSSESLAGRVHNLEIGGFTLDEVGAHRLDRLWLRGGYPSSFLARGDAAAARYRDSLIRTYLERDLPLLGVRVAPPQLERLWKMLAHWHGQLWNAAELARSLGVSEPTVRHWLDLLGSTYLVRVLQPFHENLAKRQVKTPKVYVSDAGLLHALLGVETRADLDSHPKLGASFEGFVINELVARLGARRGECFFWRTHDGAELDLLVVRGRRRLGFEIKRTDAPAVTPSMRIALADLRLDGIDVVHAGAQTFALAPKIRAVAVARLMEDIRPL